MNGGFILALIFLLIAIAALLTAMFAKIPFFESFRKYYIMSAAVYVSGAALIFIFFIMVSELPLIFAVISEVCILSVFAMSVWAIHRMGKAVTEIHEHNELSDKTKEDKE